MTDVPPVFQPVTIPAVKLRGGDVIKYTQGLQTFFGIASKVYNAPELLDVFVYLNTAANPVQLPKNFMVTLLGQLSSEAIHHTLQTKLSKDSGIHYA